MPSSTSPGQKDLLLEIWRRAGRSSDPIRLEFASHADAFSFRMALYNAIRGFKSHPDRCGTDFDLREGIMKCVAKVDPDDSRFVLVGRQLLPKNFLAAIRAAGIDPDNIETQEEARTRGLRDQQRQTDEEAARVAQELEARFAADFESRKEEAKKPFPYPRREEG